MADWPYNTKAWRKLRLAKLAADPVCYACNLRGVTKTARAVDHILAIAKGGDPVLNMCASNAVVTRDPAGSRKLDKSKAAGRIDGLVALAMTLSVAQRHEPEALPSCLEEFMD